MVQQQLLTALVAVALAAFVHSEVELEKGQLPLNFKDPVQYKDCGQLLKAGYNVSGVHRLFTEQDKSYLMHCDFRGATAYNVIQRRQYGNVDFRQPLSYYVAGFGNAQGDYWVGLNSITYLTQQQGNTVLTIQMQDYRGNNKNARYSSFHVLPYSTAFRMYVAGFTQSGGLIDDFGLHNNRTFQTYDYPDPDNCATYMKGGWWYNYCAYAYLNGIYYPPGPYQPSGSYYDGIYWKDWYGYNFSLKFVSMEVSTS